MRYRYANMASIHKQEDKPNWFCAFYDPEGFRRFKSTGTEDRRAAQKICTEIDRASELARRGKLSNEKALRIIRETAASITETGGKLAGDQAQKVLQSTIQDFVALAGGELTTYTVAQWFTQWLASRTDASKATIITYDGIIKMFLRFLGARSNRALTTLETKQIEEFKNFLNGKVAPSTVNRAVKVIKAALNNAVAKRQLEFSPADHVSEVEEKEQGRRAFTNDEVSALLKVAEPEWVTMVLLSYYTGLRLRDCANLTWRNVRLHENEIDVVAQKTKQPVQLPIAEPLSRHLSTLAGDDPDAALCPGLFGQKASWLSAEFHAAMVKAGLVAPRGHQKKEDGQGRDGRRETTKISFHSLRYSLAANLRSAGVSEAISMDIIGHETKAVHRHYAGKVPMQSKREALKGVPDITNLATKGTK